MAASFSNDIEYENGDNAKRALRVSWHESFQLVSVSFDDTTENYPAFAEDFDLQTAIKLRDELTKIIEAQNNDERGANDRSVKSLTQTANAIK